MILTVTHVEPPVTGIRMCEPCTTYIKNKCQGAGTLYITDDDVRWLNNSGEGIILPFPEIKWNQMCTHPEDYPEDCVILLVKNDEPVDELDFTDYDDSSDDDYGCKNEVIFDYRGNKTEVRFAMHEIARTALTLSAAMRDYNDKLKENDDIMGKDSKEDSKDDDDAFWSSDIPEQFDDADD